MPSRLSPRARGRVVLALQLSALVLAFFALPIARYVLEGEKVEASASAEYSEEFEAPKAIDGDLKTEWSLPDATLGWLDLTFNRPKQVNAVRITNGHNGHYMDRAIASARIVLFDDDGREVDRHELELPGIEREHTERRVRMQGKRAARLRLEVTGYAGAGSALAEIAVE